MNPVPHLHTSTSGAALTNQPITGHPSTHGDSYQLNTTNIIRQAVVTHPEKEIAHRAADGQWRSTTYAATWRRVARTAHA